MIRGIVAITLSVTLTGCISTLRYASLDDHRDMMDECRSMCGEGRVLKYRPRSGECECVRSELEVE